MVRAHPRKGTRGVRRYTRRPFGVRIFRPTDFEMFPRTEEHPPAYMRYHPELVAGSIHRRPYTIYLFNARGMRNPKKLVPTLSHETLHGTLVSEGEVDASSAVDRMKNMPYVTYNGLPVRKKTTKRRWR